MSQSIVIKKFYQVPPRTINGVFLGIKIIERKENIMTETKETLMKGYHNWLSMAEYEKGSGGDLYDYYLEIANDFLDMADKL